MTDTAAIAAVCIPFAALVAMNAYGLGRYLARRMRQRPLPADDPFLMAFGDAFGMRFTVRGDSAYGRFLVTATTDGGDRVKFGDTENFGPYQEVFGMSRRDAQVQARNLLSADGSTVWVERCRSSRQTFPDVEVRDFSYDVYRLPGFSSVEDLLMKASICGGVELWRSKPET